ncbi:hypothetical protein SDRG_13593 [Saprolegnia diclina VS20]|uniref:Uncharacterized protein n=1 Tax=Saprolegnia diclina (strain VS20) TaxID=1156394 RepID=T0PT75_SAPDV|nr:hypothetical protein SDRG_13593 [Saprolegnia diclina VS20]EQC28719.1 hypothetical protein SDRG_13593 [Saprolegnia diclina VS20]|eukprot:XP_008617911.1 hypothetical protein SDRG_13593 [Saprolegnia diclina VS20]
MADILKDRDLGMKAADTSVFCRQFDSLADFRTFFGEFVTPRTRAQDNAASVDPGIAEVAVGNETQIGELLGAVAAFQAGDLPDVQFGFDANETSLSKVSQSPSMSVVSALQVPSVLALFEFTANCLRNLHAKENGSANMGAKFNSLAGRWYKKAPKLVETSTTSAMLKRNVITATAKGQYRLLSEYVKSYNKWRIEWSAALPSPP